MPTIDEAGVKGYDMGYWFAAYVPAGTPAPVVARLRDLLVDAAEERGGEDRSSRAPAATPWTTTPDELAKFQAGEDAEVGQA